MSSQSPEGYMISGGAMLVAGIVLVVKGWRKPRPDEYIAGTVLDTRIVEGGDCRVRVSWIDKSGLKRESHVATSSGDIPTRGTVLQLVPSRFGRRDVQIARLKYRIGPGLGVMFMGAVSLAMGIVFRVSHQ